MHNLPKLWANVIRNLLTL